MGALSAFMRGVAGPGLINLSENMRRQQEQEAIRAAREKELDEQRRFQADQKEQDRQLREELAMVRGGRSTGTGGGGGGGGGALDPASARAAVVERLMGSEGMSRPEAERAVGMSETGQNGFTNDVVTNDADLSGMDRRLGAGKNVEKQPDVAKFKALMSKIGTYYSEAGSRAKSNYDVLKKGEQTGFETESGIAAGAPGVSPQRAGELATGTAVANSKPLYNDGDSNYTPAVGALTQSKVGAENALAAKRKADGANARAGAGAGGGSRVARTYTNASGKMVAIMRDGTERELGTSKDYPAMIEKAKAALLKTMDGATMKPDELEAKAVELVAQRGRVVDAPAPTAPSRAGQFKVLR